MDFTSSLFAIVKVSQFTDTISQGPRGQGCFRILAEFTIVARNTELKQKYQLAMNKGEDNGW